MLATNEPLSFSWQLNFYFQHLEKDSFWGKLKTAFLYQACGVWIICFQSVCDLKQGKL